VVNDPFVSGSINIEHDVIDIIMQFCQYFRSITLRTQLL
jgi:hypothetical protein